MSERHPMKLGYSRLDEQRLPSQESLTSFTTSKHSGTFPRAHFQTFLTIYIFCLLIKCVS